MSTSFHPQTAEFAATVIQNLPRLNAAQMQHWIGNSSDLQKVLKALECSNITVEFTDGSAVVKGQRQSLPKQGRLCMTGTVALPERTSVFDPSGFFKIREGLYVWDGFRDRVLSAARKIEEIPATAIGSYDLIVKANDAEIQRELPEGYLFEDTSVFCAHFAGMIERQAGGAEGPLLNNGCANIFYVIGVAGGVFAVRVCWRSGLREWDLRADPLSGDRWYAGGRVFSRN